MTSIVLPFHSALFILEKMELCSRAAGTLARKRYAAQYSLIGIASGNGMGIMDEKRYRLAKGSCFLMPPGSVFEVELEAEAQLEAYFFTFRVEAVGKGTADKQVDAELFAMTGKLNVHPAKKWFALLEELYATREAAGELEGFGQHILFQQVLYYLWQRNAVQGGVDPYRSVHQTIAELHANYKEDVQIEQLAKQANIGSRQYNHLFKALTGLSPLGYIAHLRINEAKRQLLVTSANLHTIARKVGFQDAYYFSRRFKQLVGESPKQYVGRVRRDLRVVALYYSGVAMSVGIQPVGANLAWWGGSAYLQEREQSIVDVGEAPSLEAIAALEPDLILLNDTHLSHYDRLLKIAPSVLIPYDAKRNIYEETRIVSELLGKAQAAGQFIERYEQQAALARERLAAAGIDGTCTAAIIRIEGNGRKFSVFGENYGRAGWAVYHGIQFQFPARVRLMRERGMQIEQQLPLHLLKEYIGEVDYLFVINEGEGIADIADRHMWEQLPAVRGQRAYELSRAMFSYLDPISVEAQLDKLLSILLNNQETGN